LDDLRFRDPMQNQIIDGRITLKLILRENTVRAELDGRLAIKNSGGFLYVVSIPLHTFHNR
jgi:hypothetical protein